MVEKPWGRTDIPAAFGAVGARQIGEIWYESPDQSALPLLVKWLFTSEKLSIQVHPNDEQAKQRGLVSGKEECWFVVHAEPGAVLGIGTKQPLSAEELRYAALSGEIEQLMDWKPVSVGDYYYIPAGTVHAIGAGVTLIEVQQYADVTYRLFDYGRPRALHLDDGVAVSVAAPYVDARSGRATGGQKLVDGPHFQLWYIDKVEHLAGLNAASSFFVVPLAGQVTTAVETGSVGDCLMIDNLHSLALSGEGRCLMACATVQ